MTQRFGFTSFLLILALIFYSFYSLMPRDGEPANAPENEFSAQRAMAKLQDIARAPHFHANAEHARVRTYLADELTKLGLEVILQTDPLLEQNLWTVKRGDSSLKAPAGYHLIRPVNVLGRLKGSGDGKALMLLSHYDSAKVPSYGASDAGSGVVTILESLRAYLASGASPENDIIVLFTDAEELGLYGAKTFVREHPWGADVGLVLNFEARGSGGPSNMIVETNGGNSALIKAFAQASLPYPVASSLMYSVYKLLPNDTDSTVFREDGDIDSFFFAFIDDHFDYHTASDTIENLDIESLQHQGSYLLPLLHHFSKADLSNLKSDEDHVYVNLPHLFMHYPFSWIYPMLVVAAVLLILLINYGIHLGKLKWGGMGRGIAALLVSLLCCGLIGYFGWELIMLIYPQYGEIQHGFPYNGHDYIAFFVLLSVALSLVIFRRLGRNQEVASLYVAPLLFWIILNALVAVYLKGGAYFIIPVYFGLVALWVLLRQAKPGLLLMTLLGAPAIFTYVALIQFFPVGLGLEMVVVSCIFTVMLFALLYHIIGFYRLKKGLAWLCAVTALLFFFRAHAVSGFDAQNRKPNSLVYFLDNDSGKAYWATYDDLLDSWTKEYLGEDPRPAADLIPTAAGSKYNRGYTFASEAPLVQLNHFDLRVEHDSLDDGNRHLEFSLRPTRVFDELFIYADSTQSYTSLAFNGIPAKTSGGLVETNAYSGRLLRMNVGSGESLKISLVAEPEAEIAFDVITYSFDLINEPLLDVKARKPEQMPKPFVNTDAIVIKRKLTFPFKAPLTEEEQSSNSSNSQYE